MTQEKLARGQAFALLYYLYQHSRDSEGGCSLWHAGEMLGFERAHVQQLAERLHDDNMLRFISLEGDVAITAFGIASVLQSVADPAQATLYFPALEGIYPDGLPGGFVPDRKLVRYYVSILRQLAEELGADNVAQLPLDDAVLQMERILLNGGCTLEELQKELMQLDEELFHD